MAAHPRLMDMVVNSVRGVIQMIFIGVEQARRFPVREVIGIVANVVQTVVRPRAGVEIPLLGGLVDDGLVLITPVDLGG